MSDITVSAPSSGRKAYSVVPNPDEPVILQLDGALTRILDISAAGFATTSESITSGSRYPFTLDLPTMKRSIKGYVDVTTEDKNDELFCRFVELSVDETEALHHYVLVRQKEALRAIRANNGLSSIR